MAPSRRVVLESAEDQPTRRRRAVPYRSERSRSRMDGSRRRYPRNVRSDEQPLALDLRRQQNEASLPVIQEEEEQLPVIQEEEEQLPVIQEDEESDPEHAGEAYEQMMELMRQQGLWRMRMELMDQIPGQPSRRDPECIYLVIELPSGNILMRRFRRSESLKYLHFFVLCHAEAPINFDIRRDSTQKLLPCEPTRECPEPPTFEELGLLPIEKLTVLKADE